MSGVADRLDGRVAMVTGAAAGIGRACARRLHEAGAAVVLADTDEAGTRQVATALGERALFVALDVADEAAWPVAMAAARDRFARLDIMVHTVAIAIAEPCRKFERLSTVAWRQVIAVNLEATFLACKHAVLAMKPHGGAILNVAPLPAEADPGELPALTAARAGVDQLSRSVALHCGRKGYGIRCNAVHPRLAGPGTDEDVAELVLLLAGDGGGFVTGAVFPVDGGTAGP